MPVAVRTSSAKPFALAERFWSKVDVLGPDECWPWQEKSRTPNGYGVAWANLGAGNRTHTAHRVAYFLGTGAAPDPDLDVMHSCDNRSCCNPAHLSEGTRTDNMRDCARKGRTSRAPRIWGERVHTAKLTAEVIPLIRLRASLGEPYPQIAVSFGVHADVIGAVVRRKTWRHV